MKRIHAVVVTALLAAFLEGCHPCLYGTSACVFQCVTSADCEGGKVCVHLSNTDAEIHTCESPCAYDADGSPNFTCPDSPLGTRCVTDDNRPFCPWTP